MTVEMPNKVYVCEYKGNNQFKGQSHFVIVVAAVDSEIAKQYIQNKIGFDCSPVWLMNTGYPTIYTSNGNVPHPVQAKILFNGNYHTYGNTQ